MAIEPCCPGEDGDGGAFCGGGVERKDGRLGAEPGGGAGGGGGGWGGLWVGVI